MDCDVVLVGLMDWNSATSNQHQTVTSQLVTIPDLYEANLVLTQQANTQQNIYPDRYNGNHLNSNQSQQSPQHLSETNLYIKNLPPEYSDNDLALLVEGCGKVKSMKAIIDKTTNKCKGFGFIDFETHEAAQNAIAQLQKKGFTAQLAKQQEQDTTNLYFANLDPDMNEQHLRNALGEFGTVVSVRILRDQQKHSRGVGFARMTTKQECEQIINTFHNKTFPDFPEKLVHVKFADASNKNKKMFKNGIEDMKSGVPIYNQAIDPSQYAPAILQQHAYPIQATTAAMFPQHLRPPINVYNSIPSYVLPTQVQQVNNHTDPSYLLPHMIQQGLQITGPGAHGSVHQLPITCVMTQQHPHLFMQAQDLSLIQPEYHHPSDLIHTHETGVA
ncbi:unnamed protein product [Didymodactylos carnosus]|uniref:RRM domain-containing protein n=1 Tax=Didymodactylos carnosus TaxID=1234261 RepID=A0A813ZQW1_9BILA|nr:unnamed protein product [Didymodactylos carnosus]CAF0965507.1 unnamed protein product [Didymodactylos carnosus]CAF3684517.1 unnamed protein product [Didymodactylos carnosus]CAF3737425.1 unnamed protein product [Didymodactylos carnosus]